MATDNSALESKLALRRHFLERHHRAAPPRVIDCCQGSGKLWRALRCEFALTTYLGLDVKSKKGRLRIDSARFLSRPGWRADIVDVDTYGQPWKHWHAIIDNARAPLTVFLTLGKAGGGINRISEDSRQMLGIPARTPPLLMAKVAPLVCAWQLSRCLERFHVVECKEASSSVNARYIGIRLSPC